MVDIKIENENKRKRNDGENGSTSVTSPLSKKNDVKEPVKTYVGNTSLVDLGSERYLVLFVCISFIRFYCMKNGSWYKLKLVKTPTMTCGNHFLMRW